ncbi:RDD family protein [Marinimicrobium sp. ABcell2]|uniref:RDD family protein n=1 Tax=Marinimicrobium sp. ABcell2 TaxID=3069751 RepID=UPI0027B4AE41|nr:RDD family protein [Marinimicrobium sp. ABcell2]MDQ2077245.1 RDD family protein [Marinimicrobium sp. ABcell2]
MPTSPPRTDLQHVSARLLRRFAAMVYDSLLLIAVALAYGAVVTFINVLLQGAPAEGERMQWGVWRFPVFVGLLVVLAGFFCYFWRRSGQTLGMRAWRLKLVDGDSGALASLKQCVLRSLVAPVSLLCLGMGYFWRWVDPQRHTLHGRLSKTRVILLPKEKN